MEPMAQIKPDPIRILTLDGGDIHAVSQMELLGEYMHRVAYDRKEEKVLPSKYFHVIGGTGPGGVFAALLGIDLTPEEAQEEFITIYKSVFSTGDNDPASRSVRLEAAIKDLLKRKNLPLDIQLLRVGQGASTCRVFLSAAPAANQGVCQIFRNYQTRERPSNATLVEAVRATWAYPDLFVPVHIGPDGRKAQFVGCGYGFNNPTREAIKEAYDEFGPMHPVACILNLGCGTASPSDSPISISRDCERIANELAGQFSAVDVYYRFSDSQDITTIQDPGRISASTSHYLLLPEIGKKLDDSIRASKTGSGLAIKDLYQVESTFLAASIGLPPLSAFFVDRLDLSTEMERIYLNRIQSGVRIMVLSGLGGAGKTQIVAKFVEDHATDFGQILFLNAGSRDALEAQLISKVRTLSGVRSVRTIEGALSILVAPQGNMKPNCLIVYDGADDPKFDLARYFPNRRDGYTIITTRNDDLRNLSPNGHIKVDTMTTNDAVALFMKAAFEPGQNPSLGDMDEIRLILEDLGYLAIAIVQAGRLIRARKCLKSYRKQLKESRKRLLDKPMGPQLDSGHQSFYAALDVTRPSLSHRALQMLNILSFLNPAGIPFDIIIRAAQQSFAIQPYDFLPRSSEFFDSIQTLQSIFSPAGDPDQDTWELIEELQSYSLITLNETEGHRALHFHCLVVAWTQDRLHIEERENLRAATVRLLVCNTDKGNEEKFEAVFPHVHVLSEDLERLHVNDLAGLMNVVCVEGNASVLAHSWRFIQAELIRTCGDEDPRTTEATLHLADAYLRKGSGSEASKLDRKAVEICRRTLGDSHPLTLRALTQRATGFYTRGQYEDAEILQQEVLTSLKQLKGVDKSLLAQAMEDLADTYDAQGLSEDAKDLRVDALKLRKEIHAPNHSNICRLEELITEFHDDEEVSFPDTLFQQAVSKYGDEWERRFNQEWKLMKADTGSSRLEAPHEEDIDKIQRKAELYNIQGLYEEASRLRLHILEMKVKVLVPSNIDIGAVFDAIRRIDEFQGDTNDTLQRRLGGIETLLKTLGNVDDPVQQAIFSVLDANFALLTHNKYPDFPSDSPTIVKGLMGIFEKSILDCNDLTSFELLTNAEVPDYVTPRLATWMVILSATKIARPIRNCRSTFVLLAFIYMSLGRIEEANTLMTLIYFDYLFAKVLGDKPWYNLHIQWYSGGLTSGLTGEEADRGFSRRPDPIVDLDSVSFRQPDPIEAIGRLTQGKCTQFSRVLRLRIAASFTNLGKRFGPIYRPYSPLDTGYAFAVGSLLAGWATLCACRLAIDTLDGWPDLKQGEILTATDKLLGLYQVTSLLALSKSKDFEVKNPLEFVRTAWSTDLSDMYTGLSDRYNSNLSNPLIIYPHWDQGNWDQGNVITLWNRSVDMQVIPASEPSVSLLSTEGRWIHTLIQNRELFSSYLHRNSSVAELAQLARRSAQPLTDLDLSPNTHDHAQIKTDVSELIKKQLCAAVKAMHTILHLRGCRIDHDVVLLHESCPLHDMNILVRL